MKDPRDRKTGELPTMEAPPRTGAERLKAAGYVGPRDRERPCCARCKHSAWTGEEKAFGGSTGIFQCRELRAEIRAGGLCTRFER